MVANAAVAINAAAAANVATATNAAARDNKVAASAIKGVAICGVDLRW